MVIHLNHIENKDGEADFVCIKIVLFDDNDFRICETS